MYKKIKTPEFRRKKCVILTLITLKKGMGKVCEVGSEGRSDVREVKSEEKEGERK